VATDGFDIWIAVRLLSGRPVERAQFLLRAVAGSSLAAGLSLLRPCYAQWMCGRYAAARKESGPDLARIEAGSSDLPIAQRFPLAAGEEACATRDDASNHIRLQRFTVW
jgi:hypothetical protein